MIQYGLVKSSGGGAWRTTMPAGQTGPGLGRCGPMPVPVVHAAAAAAVGRVERRRRSAEQRCCVPSGCSRYDGELIDPQEPGDAVKVVCSNPACVVGSWMHADCYEDWQQRVLFYIRYHVSRVIIIQVLSAILTVTESPPKPPTVISGCIGQEQVNDKVSVRS